MSTYSGSKHGRDDESVASSVVSSTSIDDNQRRRDWLEKIKTAFENIEWTPGKMDELVEEAKANPFHGLVLLLQCLSKDSMEKECNEMEEKKIPANREIISDANESIFSLSKSVNDLSYTLDKLLEDKEAIVDQISVKTSEKDRDQFELLQQEAAKKNAELENRAYEFVVKFTKNLCKTPDKDKKYRKLGVELHHVRADAGVLIWDDLMKIKTVNELWVKICAVADHGLVDNLDFRGLWLIHAGDSAWLKRNSPKPWIKTGRLKASQLMKQRIRLANYLGIEVPEEVLKSLGVPSSIRTIPEEPSTEELLAMLQRRGVNVQVPQADGAPMDDN